MSCTITVPSLLHQLCVDSTRYALSGVLIDTKSGLAAACDGRCFAVTTVDVQQHADQTTELPPVVVPRQLLNAGGKRPRVVHLGEREASRVDGQANVTAEYVDGSYPALAKIVSTPPKTLAHLDNVMGGLEVAQVRIDWKPPNATPHQIAVVIDAVDQLIDQEPLLAHPLSLCRVLAALPGDATPVEKMPLAELLPPPLKLALYDPDQGRAIVTFRVKDLGTAKYEAVFERLEAGLKQLQNNHVGFDFTMVGDPIGRWKDLYRIVSDLALSLGTASFEILIVMALAFRSLRLGLIAIVPNMIPLAASGTFMVLLGWPLDIVSVCSFTICLGIAVDDTIHFLSRYREEMTHQNDHRLAIEQAFQGVGTGMIMTTIVLISGFCSVLVSNTRDHRVFGVLGIITLMSALLCDLFLLPSLLAHFDGRLLARKPR